LVKAFEAALRGAARATSATTPALPTALRLPFSAATLPRVTISRHAQRIGAKVVASGAV
jgi:hypothetical protein